jgi:glyoxylase-like metal-dependent hydrolase (beta-lactamase superfamily II)
MRAWRAFLFLSAATLCLWSALSTAQSVPDWCKAEPRAVYSTLPRVPLHDAAAAAWFEVYRVAPDTYAIYEPHQWEETIGYLILGRTRAALLDTGMGIGDLPAVVHQLTPLPIVVLNSHTHNDHVGGNWQFDTAPNEVDSLDTPYTRAHAAGTPAYAKNVKGEIAPGALCGALPAGFDAQHYRTHPWHVTRWLHDGDTVALGGRTLQIIATPGHAPDAVVVLDRARGLLFTGDSYYNAHIYVFGPGADAMAYHATVARMAELSKQVQLVLPAHNEPIAQPGVLPALAAAYDAVLAGKGTTHSIGDNPAGEGGAVTYSYGGFYFDIDAKLLAAAQQRPGSSLRHTSP